MHFNARGLVLEFLSFVDCGAVLTFAKLLHEPRIFFDELLLGKGVLKMKGTPFLVIFPLQYVNW